MSTGNDIVALSAINVSRTKQLKFYSRILSASEQALYQQPQFSVIPFENYVWLLWSVKEAAFKYWQRLNSALVFSPTKFIVTTIEIPAGHTLSGFSFFEKNESCFNPNDYIKTIISYGDDTLYSMSLLFDELIMSVVNENKGFDNILWGIKRIDDDDPGSQSSQVRTFLNERLCRMFPGHDFEIGKDPDGAPFAADLVNNITLPVSFSHHDHFVGYSLQLG